MENNDIILSVILVAAVFVPMWLFIRASNKTSKLLVKMLKKLNKKLPQVYDVWTMRAIAVTPEQRLTFINLKDNIEKIIDLDEAESCMINRNGKPSAPGSLDIKGTDTLDLVISTGSSGRPHSLNMYNCHVDDPVQTGHHVIITKKWQELIQSAINKKVRA